MLRHPSVYQPPALRLRDTSLLSDYPALQSLAEPAFLNKKLSALPGLDLSKGSLVRRTVPESILSAPPPEIDPLLPTASVSPTAFSGGAPLLGGGPPAAQGSRIANSGYFARRGAMIGAGVGLVSGMYLGVVAQWVTGTFVLLGTLTFMGGVLGAVARMVLAVLLRG